MPFIELTNGMRAQVDVEDLELVNTMRWGALKTRNGRVYARSTKRPQILLHRLLVLTELDVDHVNGDGLDCRRANLREASESDNLHNRGAQANSASGVKGVSWSCARRRWVASFTLRGVTRRRRCKTQAEATEQYAAWVAELAPVFGRSK